MKQGYHYKLRLNNINKIEELLQEMYDESCENIKVIQDNMNRLTSSVSLNEEPMESKAKYGKVMNDFLTNRNKAISTKLDIAKLMSEILKYNGNIDKASKEGSIGDFDDFIERMQNQGKQTEKETVNIYELQ